MTPEQRDKVCAEAVTWAATPYHPNCAVKGVGCDCALGPLEIYRNVFPELRAIQPPKYVRDWHLHQGDEIYLNFIRDELKLPEVSNPAPGDFVLFRQGRLFSHGAVVLGWPRIMHAVVGGGFCYADVSQEPRLVRAPRHYFTLG